MTNNYIENQLVKTLYNDCTVSEELALKFQVSENPDLQRSLFEMKQMKNKLDHSMSKPSYSSVQIIMEYSRKHQQETSL